MKTATKTGYSLIILAGIIHLFILANLAAHFKWQNGWSPQLTGKHLPAHWENADRAAIDTTNVNCFGKKLLEKKAAARKAKGLMFYPQRKADNFGLDLLVRDSTRTDPGGDFFQLYYAGHAALKGLSIYENDPPGLKRKQADKLKKQIPFHPPNRYPPGFIYSIGLILTLFSPWNAYLFWVIVHEILLGFCIYLTWQLLKHDMIRFGVATVMWLVFLPWYLELYMGQTTFIIMTGTFALGALFILKRGAGTAGSFWTATLLTKPLTLLYVPLLFRLRRFGILATGLSALTITSMGYFLFHTADAKIFFGWALGQKMVISLGNYCFQNLVFHFLFSETLVKVISWGFILFGVVFTFAIKKSNPVQVLLIWICVYFLGYAHVWQHHQVLLLGGVVLAYAATRKERFILPWLAATFPSPFYLFEGHWNWWREIIYLSVGTLPVLLLLILILIPSTWNKLEVTR